ncbi:NAD(+) diphosphatase [Solihabitans fulvus]|uniref:NAD(+) diphosphatase n=1 Tax=Solihabitans fulvus TaxID=1892852 RepID=A0A5B2WQS0_9PSEU|nr:NAD(+) diphosphatase [Solihabitans fulvus]KAA2253855.1 NAD(+) diphosphatase [Solihabitans fulvus]
MTEHALAYTGGHLDRAAALRTDPAWIADALARPDSTVIPLWRDRCLTRHGRPVTLPAPALPDTTPVFLGLRDTTAIFAADLSHLTEPAALDHTGATDTHDLRAVVNDLAPADAATIAYARGITHWHRNQQFCGACGTDTDVRDGGHLRACRNPDCEKLLFPRIEPAVIMVIQAPATAAAPARCLLGRHHGSDEDSYSTLAGFVEIGENLEDAVRREAAEEAGVRIGAVAYQASQAWPFPAGLMVGFRATALTDTTAVDGVELLDARWFTPAELRDRATRRPLARTDSIGDLLLRSWLDDHPA